MMVEFSGVQDDWGHNEPFRIFYTKPRFDGVWRPWDSAHTLEDAKLIFQDDVPQFPHLTFEIRKKNADGEWVGLTVWEAE